MVDNLVFLTLRRLFLGFFHLLRLAFTLIIFRKKMSKLKNIVFKPFSIAFKDKCYIFSCNLLFSLSIIYRGHISKSAHVAVTHSGQ